MIGGSICGLALYQIFMIYTRSRVCRQRLSVWRMFACLLFERLFANFGALKSSEIVSPRWIGLSLDLAQCQRHFLAFLGITSISFLWLSAHERRKLNLNSCHHNSLWIWKVWSLTGISNVAENLGFTTDFRKIMSFMIFVIVVNVASLLPPLLKVIESDSDRRMVNWIPKFPSWK